MFSYFDCYLTLLEFAQVSDAMDFLRQNLSYWHDEAERLVCFNTFLCDKQLVL